MAANRGRADDDTIWVRPFVVLDSPQKLPLAGLVERVHVLQNDRAAGGAGRRKRLTRASHRYSSGNLHDLVAPIPHSGIEIASYSPAACGPGFFSSNRTRTRPPPSATPSARWPTWRSAANSR